MIHNTLYLKLFFNRRKKRILHFWRFVNPAEGDADWCPDPVSDTGSHHAPLALDSISHFRIQNFSRFSQQIVDRLRELFQISLWA